MVLLSLRRAMRIGGCLSCNLYRLFDSFGCIPVILWNVNCTLIYYRGFWIFNIVMLTCCNSHATDLISETPPHFERKTISNGISTIKDSHSIDTRLMWFSTVVEHFGQNSLANNGGRMDTSMETSDRETIPLKSNRYFY